MKYRALAASGLLATCSIAGASTASAGPPPPRTSFTVVTSFVSQPSDIVEADGPWSDCTAVTDVDAWFNVVGPRKDQFSGTKQVHCDSGDVFIHYDATTNWRNGQGLTFGTWSVMGSDNPNIGGGGGTVSGDSRGCEDCIVDVFTGRVYPADPS